MPKKNEIFSHWGGTMTGSIEGLGGGGTGEVTGAELDLLEEGKIKLAGAKSKLTDALILTEGAQVRMDAFEELVLFNYGDLTGLRTELNRARGEMHKIKKEKAKIEDIVRRINIQVTLAEGQLGKGTDSLRVYLDKVGELEGEQPATELLESLESERATLLESVQELEDHLNSVSADLGYGDLTEHSKINSTTVDGRKVETFEELDLPSRNSVAEGSFLQRRDLIDKEVANINVEEGYILSIANALSKGGIDLEDDNALAVALKEIQKIPRVGGGQRAEGLLAKAIRESTWGSLDDDRTAMGYISQASQELDSTLAYLEEAKSQFNIEDKTGVFDLKAALDNYWAQRVAIGIFRLKQEEDVGVPTAFEISNSEYVLRAAADDQDFISQGGYVELVNILNAMEDAIENEGKGTLFTKDESNEFWGITEKKIFQVVSPSGVVVDVEQNVRLSAADRAAKKKEHLGAWETTTELKDFDLNVDDMADEDFFKMVCRILHSSEQLKYLSTGGALSPGLAAQARFTSDLVGILGEAHEKFRVLQQTGRDHSVTLLDGTETTSGMLTIRKAFKTWQEVGGFNHFHHMKSALKQINIESGDTAATIIRPATQDLLFFEYASTGEAALNRQIGSLGETMKLLNDYLDNLNSVDGVLSKPTLDVNHKGLLENSDSFLPGSDGVKIVNGLNGLFELLKVKSDVIGYQVNPDGRAYKTDAGDVGQLNSAQRAAVANLLARAKLRLTGDSGVDREGRDNETKKGTLEELEQGNSETTEEFEQKIDDKREDIKDVFKTFAKFGEEGDPPAALENYTLDATNMQMHLLNKAFESKQDDTFFSYIGILGNRDSPADIAEKIQEDLYHIFNDEGFSGNLSEAITHGQGVNDTLKQNLKKTMFVYQEFIKSAGTVMEKIAEMVKGMASRIR